RIMNNSFKNCNQVFRLYSDGAGGLGAIEELIFKNNAWDNTCGGAGFGDDADDALITPLVDHNIINYRPSTSGINFKGVPYYSSASWQDALGGCPGVNHGCADKWEIDPLFASAADLRVRPGSAAIDAGEGMGLYFTTDKDSISRPQGSGWDIGAYEYVQNLPGDLSGDGAITAYDAALALQLGRGELEAAQIAQKAAGLL
ncbi:MAG: choice-of-anchor Q domain-containing protein, partial [Candidatus Omnitrophota bacterium]|nr:choice-of-anchor Q domain-containing protein [Candidatus Omnitrophota bacterium]